MVCLKKKKTMEENNNPPENGLVIQVFRNQMPPSYGGITRYIPQYSNLQYSRQNANATSGLP